MSDHMPIKKRATYYGVLAFRKLHPELQKKSSRAGNNPVCSFAWCRDDPECLCDICCAHRDGKKTVIGACACQRCRGMWPSFKRENTLACAAVLGARGKFE